MKSRKNGDQTVEPGFLSILDPSDLKITPMTDINSTGRRNALAQVTNTDPTVPWLTSYVETALLRAVWYPVTVATRSHAMTDSRTQKTVTASPPQ